MEVHCPYFVQKRNETGQFGHSDLKKLTAAVRMLAYSCPTNSIDDWIRIEHLHTKFEEICEGFHRDLRRNISTSTK